MPQGVEHMRLIDYVQVAFYVVLGVLAVLVAAQAIATISFPVSGNSAVQGGEEDTLLPTRSNSLFFA